MNLWPWSRKSEKRSTSFEDRVVSAIVADATGAAVSADGLAATEAAAGLIGRCFASGEVTGDRFGVVSPAVLELIGRELIRRGEAVFLIDGDRSPRLVPCGTWDVRGGDDSARWFYRVDTFGASEHRTRLAPSAGVVHARINVDPVRPWLGRSPIRVAVDTAATAAHSEKGAAAEVKTPSARIAPIPTPKEDQRDTFGSRLRKGGVVAVQAGANPITSGGQEPANRWTPAVMRPDPTATHAEIRRDAARDVLSACGIPGVLFEARADGTATREGYRRLVFTTLAPWSRLVAAELADKLDSPELTISFAGLHGADLATRGRALKQLVDAGVSLAESMAITGLSESG